MQTSLLSAILASSSVASYEYVVFFRNYVTSSPISGEKLSAIKGTFWIPLPFYLKLLHFRKRSARF